MKKIIKQYLPIGAVVVGSILLLSLLSYIGFKSENVQQTTTDKKSKMQYVLVNEDQGVTFEGKKYALGSDFVTLINQDSQNRWETTTRDIATRGIEDGQFDAQIIIPQDFSERLLSLQSINPEQALVEYQVREGQNEVTNQAIQTKVNDVLKDFNQRIVQMYFSSIVGNLAEAQQNVNLMVGVENTHRGALETNVYSPFKELPANFTSVTETASILEEENKVFTSEQEAFVEAVKSLMEANNNGLEENSKSTEEVQKSVNDYADEANEKIETSIKQFNEQFELQKEQLETQWGNDLSNYKKQYDQFNTSITNQLGLFYTPGTEQTASSGVYSDFSDAANDFKQKQETRKSELANEIKALEKQVEELKTLKKNIATKYFSDEEKTPEDIKNDDGPVKLAISHLFMPQTYDSVIPKSYSDSIDTNLDDLTTLPLPSRKDFNTLLEILSKNYSIDEKTQTELNNAYDIVTKYDKSLGTNEASSTFDLIKPASLEQPKKDFSVTNTIGIALDPSKEYVTQTLTVNSAAEVSNLPVIAASISNQLNTFITSNKLDYTVTVIPGTDQNTITITTKNNEIEKPSVPEEEPSSSDTASTESSTNDSTTSGSTESSSPEQTESSVSDENNSSQISSKEPLSPVTVACTFETKFNWMYNNIPENRDEFFTTNYQWYLDGSQKASGTLAAYIDQEESLKEDLPKLLELYTQLTSAAEKITLIYGDPGTVLEDGFPANDDTLTIEKFAAFIKDKEESIAELASKKSVYHLYNNLDDERAQGIVIPDSLVENYKNNGIELFYSVDEQITKLETVIGKETDQNEDGNISLHGTLNLMIEPKLLLDRAELLKSWYDSASLAIEATYNSWSEADKVAAKSVITENNPHPEKNQTEGINTETNSLVKAIQSLASSSKETAQATAESAAKVKDISPDIQNLKESSKQVETNATGILNNLDKTVSDVQETTKDNTDYAEQFDKVLANTRNGGADNKTVFNFLSNPIQDKGEFGKTRQSSLIPYYATIIGAFVSLFVAIGLQRFMKRRQVSKEDLVLNPSRTWYNIPNVTLAVIIITLLAVTFGIDLSLTLYSTIKITWFSYAFLTLLAGTLVILGCMRQFRVLTLYICGGILGLFFLLTPLIGVATKSGSFINLLFRFSPLQNIQNGFTALLNGGSIGWISYVVLIVLTIVGLTLNFLVKPEESVPSSQ